MSLLAADLLTPRIRNCRTMDEYIFFDPHLRDKFTHRARELGVEYHLQDDDLGIVVAIPEDLPEEVTDSLEACYEQLMEEQSELVDQSEGGLKKHLAGVRLDLPGGRSCMVKLDPDMANRLLSCFSLDEVQELFAAVARSIESPDDEPLCKC